MFIKNCVVIPLRASIRATGTESRRDAFFKKRSLSVSGTNGYEHQTAKFWESVNGIPFSQKTKKQSLKMVYKLKESGSTLEQTK